MKLLTIDLGHYSIRFIQYDFNRKKASVIDYQEIQTGPVEKTEEENVDHFRMKQLELVGDYLLENEFDGKIIFQIPNEYLTTRFLELPANTKKKAQAMVPFQLDDELPFSINEAYYQSFFNKIGGHFQTITAVCDLSEFERYYKGMQTHRAIPAILAPELFFIQSFAQLYYKKISDSLPNLTYCLLDVGHQTSKAYFIHKDKIIANHVSYTAGHNIDQLLSNSYNLSLDEAIQYKHDNCFFLTENQMTDVDEEQRDFAKLMSQGMSGLVRDFRRWEIGLKAKYGLTLDHIYLTGGSSQIKNFSNFLTQNLKIKTDLFDPFSNLGQIRPSGRNFPLSQTQCFINELMIIGQMNSSSPPNFLAGKYQGRGTSLIPLQSTVFMASRTLILAACLLVALLTERIILNSKNKMFNRKIVKMIKDPVLGLSRPQRNRFRKRPETILNIIKKKNRSIKEEIKTIRSFESVNAIKSFGQLSRIVQNNKNVELLSFSSAGGRLEAKFKAINKDELEALFQKLKSTYSSNEQAAIQKIEGGVTLKIKK